MADLQNCERAFHIWRRKFWTILIHAVWILL